MTRAEEIKVLENFIETIDVDGICGGWVDGDVGEDGRIWVYIVIDLDWLESSMTKPGYISNRMRQGMKNEIKQWTNIDVEVGSIAKRCSEI